MLQLIKINQYLPANKIIKKAITLPLLINEDIE